ncbi:MAG: hypothetical protein ACK5JS_09925 [Mangrovibacterium sp.]
MEVYGIPLDKSPDTPIEECVLLGEYSESQALSKSNKWTWSVFDSYYRKYTTSKVEEFKELNDTEENYQAIVADVTGNKYRYLKFRVTRAFDSYSTTTGLLLPYNGAVAMEELEVYIKSEE